MVEGPRRNDLFGVLPEKCGCKGWMVEVVGLKLATRHPVIEPVSACAGNGNFLRRDRPVQVGSTPSRDGFGDARETRKPPFPRAYPALCRNGTVCKGWVVETVGLELRTHHPVIEPVSASAGNGNLRCGDRGSKSGSPLGRGRYGDYEKQAKARISRQ